MPRRQSIPRLLGRLNKPGYDRDAVVRGVALALDLVTPLAMVPGIGPVLEAATDLIWMEVAEALVAGVERAVAKKLERHASKESPDSEKPKG